MVHKVVKHKNKYDAHKKNLEDDEDDLDYILEHQKRMRKKHKPMRTISKKYKWEDIENE